MKFTTDGLVIKENNVGESDRVVVVLTRDRGLVHAFVSGARRTKSKNSASTALLAFSSFSFTKTKDTFRITEAETNEVFFGLRSDIGRLSLSQYICELCQVLVQEDTESEEILRLALNSLYLLCDDKTDIYRVKAVFELRLITVSGFMPDIVGCRECGSDKEFPLFLDLPGGDIICHKCRKNGNISGNFAELDATTLAAMRHIAYSDFNRLFSFTLPMQRSKYLSIVTERYLLAQTDHRFRTLEFFHSMETRL